MKCTTHRSKYFARRRHLCAILALSTLAGIASIHAPAKEPNRVAMRQPATVWQYSTLPALSLGLYDGTMTFGEVLKHGDFGVGTFDALDGEAVILDGKAWQVRADGGVYSVGKNALTPFAAVTHFASDETILVMQPLEYSALQNRISKTLPTPNVPCAVAIRGTFARIKVRSVPRQSKPYRKLAEVVKTQSVWEWQNVKGTLVGFRFPAYLSGVNLADYHFHFLSDDNERGGHVLDCQLQTGKIEIQTLRGFEMWLPSGSDFDQANLTGDQSADLQAAEKAVSH
jgi:acetolactate decarboxylase